MRKHLRALARANMERQGVEKMNKHRYNAKGFRIPSEFATNWRNFAIIPPGVKKACERDRAAQQKKRTARENRCTYSGSLSQKTIT